MSPSEKSAAVDDPVESDDSPAAFTALESSLGWRSPGGIPVVFRIFPNLTGKATGDREGIWLHLEHARFCLLRGFDQLMCLEGLRGFEHFAHQIETVRKVLRHFRGRVLLADEVGLGKTIEACLLLAKTFSWLNVRVRPRDISATSLEYHTWRFLATLASEDHWEALAAVTVNAASGAVVDLPDPLALWELQPSLCDDRASHRDTFACAASAVGRNIRVMAGEFIARMESRLGRDRKRLRDYYNAMLREANARKTRSRHMESAEDTEAGKTEIDAHKRAVDLELRRKLIELDQRYAIEATLRPLALIRTEIPVMRVRLEVIRKQAKRIHDFYWNPLLKHFEPLPCSCCLTESFALAFSNEKVAP